jgi:hypothetical protein
VLAQDNGTGMPHEDIPGLLGRVLSGTKYGVKQTRGKFGLGAKMALIWSKLSTGLPIEVLSARRKQAFISYYKLDIDIHKCAAPGRWCARRLDVARPSLCGARLHPVGTQHCTHSQENYEASMFQAAGVAAMPGDVRTTSGTCCMELVLCMHPRMHISLACSRHGRRAPAERLALCVCHGACGRKKRCQKQSHEHAQRQTAHPGAQRAGTSPTCMQCARTPTRTTGRAPSSALPSWAAGSTTGPRCVQVSGHLDTLTLCTPQ